MSEFVTRAEYDKLVQLVSAQQKILLGIAGKVNSGNVGRKILPNLVLGDPSDAYYLEPDQITSDMVRPGNKPTGNGRKITAEPLEVAFASHLLFIKGWSAADVIEKAGLLSISRISGVKNWSDTYFAGYLTSHQVLDAYQLGDKSPAWADYVKTTADGQPLNPTTQQEGA